MKAIKNVLFFNAVEPAIELIFQALFKKQQISDAVLANSGLNIQTTGLQSKQDKPIEDHIRNALAGIGICDFEYEYKHMFAHPELIQWADVILVPTLLEEDIICLNFPEAWSKTSSILCYYQPLQETGKTKSSNRQEEKGYDSIIAWFSTLLPFLSRVIKDSYCDALVSKGQCICSGSVIGPAFVARSGKELEKFEAGSIMVIDRPGIFLSQNIDKAMSSIKKSGTAIPEQDNSVCLKKECEEFVSRIEGKTGDVYAGYSLRDGIDYFRKAIEQAKGLVFSRGRNRGEMAARMLGIPCVSSCIGATEQLSCGQVIIVDAGRGEVYDAERLLKL
jgi:phosphohistidine swiveling domain-containing protein